MKNIKISYQYDGSSFMGFQRQPEKRTVQGEIEKCLFRILKEKIDLTSSGRTDRGVHAMHQVSNFFTAVNIPLDKLFYALSHCLPEDILLLELEEARKDFHARFSAKTRSYCYRITWKKSPFERRYKTYVKKKIDSQSFFKILEIFMGKHNFQNFRLQDDAFANPIREIYSIQVKEVDEGMDIYIEANAFLKSQIRIMLGTAFQVYFQKVESNRIEKMLKEPDKEFPKYLADPNGLYLYHIKYDEE
ncbi:tRNA pseudouridine(38-40) synthase TruA [Fusobacterium gonidiaformans]|uniref:tRNA pseudouridine(38-40) synthase TruA n=1 Tax=Fusobacterium gonidiaformans TaxID=849 RepID=UPI0001BC66FD|nr:tRNA pseudouridine(38-40) synthase TruA [Fusobacterium gonidiaformans]AVQ16395.1 tRNA pseudouridine(38-40) synthase TruA [Fusobacterium gonidiaformans ATCC 25563]EFS28969.1 tRNA pseudouridine synthase A [Fusobacterium gonidiaformans ATCC 25563]